MHVQQLKQDNSFRVRSINLATLFLGKPPRQFTST